MPVPPVPSGYHSLTPHLICDGAKRAIDWYRKVFAAQVRMCMDQPDGRVGHAELQLGDSVLMLADEFPDLGVRAPKAYGGSPASLMLYVPDVDTVFARALANGARQDRPLQNQFYGDRTGTVIDPFGHKWTIATHVEDVSPQEMERRAAKERGGTA